MDVFTNMYGIYPKKLNLVNLKLMVLEQSYQKDENQKNHG